MADNAIYLGIIPCEWSKLNGCPAEFDSETTSSYMIIDAHQGIHLPSPCSEADLYRLGGDQNQLPPHSTEQGPTACTALFIHTHLARRLTPILDSFATVSPAKTSHELVLRFDASLDAFQDALPAYFRLYPLTDTRFDSTRPYLASHRVRLHSTLLAYRAGVHRTHLPFYLGQTVPAGIRQVVAQVCLSALRVQREAKMLDAKLSIRLFNPVIIFESAVTLALIAYVERSESSASMYPLQRAGVAEGVELLDKVVSSADGVYARKAIRVLRAVLIYVDSKP